MIQGTYLKIPETGDRGTLFCPSISENFSTLDSHAHDGVNSNQISSKSIIKSTLTLLAGAWVSTGKDYKQIVTLPSGFDFDTSTIKSIIYSGVNIGAEFHPTINKISPTTFELHCIYGDVDVKLVIS